MTYEYDDHEIKCLNYDGDWRPVEPHCLKCGYKPDECKCDKFSPATYWDENAERWIDGRPRPRLRFSPPMGPPKENEPKYDTTTFLWSTIEELLEDFKPTTQLRFRRWKRKSELHKGAYQIELDYRQLKPVGRWMYWAIRPCDNYSWVKIGIMSGSPMEMEWCESLPEEQDEE